MTAYKHQASVSRRRAAASYLCLVASILLQTRPGQILDYWHGISAATGNTPGGER